MSCADQIPVSLQRVVFKKNCRLALCEQFRNCKIRLLVLAWVLPAVATAQTTEYKYVYEVPSECQFVSYVMGFGKTLQEAEAVMIGHAKSAPEEGDEKVVEADTLYFGWPGIDPEEEEEMEFLFNMGPDHHLELELDFQSKGSLYSCL